MASERTFATHVLGPFAMTRELLPIIQRTGDGRVIANDLRRNVCRTAPDVKNVMMGRDGYDGLRAYARAKRAQVALNEEWALREPSAAVFHAVHPGWADTPGVQESLPASTGSWARCCATRTRARTPWSGWPPPKNPCVVPACCGSTATASQEQGALDDHWAGAICRALGLPSSTHVTGTAVTSRLLRGVPEAHLLADEPRRQRPPIRRRVNTSGSATIGHPR